MVSAENRAPLSIAIPIYFVVLGGLVYWASRQMAQMKHGGLARAQITAHYLGGRQFDRFVTAGTFFSSLFSGYTVIGVPNSAFEDGYFISWWLPSLMAVACGIFGTGVRMRKLSVEREHLSPVDFITDRFQSQLLRYTILFLQALPALIYLSAQVIAVKTTFNSIFDFETDNYYPVIIIMLLICMFEWVGGLSSVALTDSLQCIVMIASFLILPAVIKRNFGGWEAIDVSTYPKPEIYQTLSKEEQWSFWQLSIINFSFFTLPHFIQRNYAAKDLHSLKTGYIFMTLGPWFTTFVGVFMGTVGVVILGEGAKPDNPFTAILEEVMNTGNAGKAAGVIAITASLAAIMSTADSLIIAISHLVTMELIFPFTPKATPRHITWYARIVSLISVLIALAIGIFWDDGLTDLSKIQFPLSTQAVPAFLIGLFSKAVDVHPWSLVAGAVFSTVYVIVFYFDYLRTVQGAMPINAGVTGFIMNIVVVVSTEMIRRNLPPLDDLSNAQDSSPVELLFPRPEWDIPAGLQRFGKKPLSPQRIWRSMDGVWEPLTNWYWVLFFFLTITMVTPMTPEYDPPLDENNQFVYLPSVVRGIPWWAFKLFVMSAITTLILVYELLRMPSEFPPEREDSETDTDSNSRLPVDGTGSPPDSVSCNQF